MPFVFLLIGAGLLVVVVQGNARAATKLLSSEFSGQKSFVPWVSALVILCALGYIKTVRPITDSFVGLIILVMIIVAETNGQNFFASFNQQIRNPVAPTPEPAAASNPVTYTPGSAVPNGSMSPADPNSVPNNPIFPPAGGYAPDNSGA